jgi:uncharacterized coiled-coil DUF342 family protein
MSRELLQKALAQLIEIDSFYMPLPRSAISLEREIREYLDKPEEPTDSMYFIKACESYRQAMNVLEQDRDSWKNEAINGGNAPYLREQVEILNKMLAEVVEERDDAQAQVRGLMNLLDHRDKERDDWEETSNIYAANAEYWRSQLAEVIKERDTYRTRWLKLQTERNDRVWKEIRDGLREPTTLREGDISERSEVLSTKASPKRVPR